MTNIEKKPFNCNTKLNILFNFEAMDLQPHHLFIAGGVYAVLCLAYFAYKARRKKTIVVKYPHINDLKKVPDIIDYPRNLHITLINDREELQEDIYCDMVINMEDLISGNYKVPDEIKNYSKNHSVEEPKNNTIYPDKDTIPDEADYLDMEVSFQDFETSETKPKKRIRPNDYKSDF